MPVSSPNHSATLPLYAAVGRIRPTRIATLVLVASTLVALASSGAPRFLQATHIANPFPGTSGEQREGGLQSLPVAAQATISGAIGRDSPAYHASTTPGGFRTATPAHGLITDFGKSGVLVQVGTGRLGLTLRSIGYGAELHRVPGASPTATKNRVEYRRGALTEWYVNGPLGLQQGFTLAAPRAKRNSGPLTLALTLSGTLRASLEPGSTTLTLTPPGQTASLRYRGLAAWDASGRALPASLVLDGKTLLLRVDDARVRYPVTIDPFVEQAKLTASDGPGDIFGSSVAVSGDTVVVGAPLDDVGTNSDQGSAYVFVKPGGGWASATETAKLTASDGAALDNFGSSVAVSGDTVVVGASFDNAPNENQGSAYVFVKPGGGWANGTETAKLTASDGAEQDQFGAVAVSGDTVVVGARLDDVAPNSNQGSAYVFVKPGGGWASATQTAKLTASDGAVGDSFGGSVAVSGDTVVVGQDSGFGSAYVFVKPGGGWASATQTAKLTASDGAGGDGFGFSVAVSGDTVVVGARLDHVGTNADQGSAYVFVKPGGGWANGTETAKLTASDGAADDRLGQSVAVSGDTVVVGAPLDNVGANADQGSAYDFVKPGGGWASATETAKLTASDGAAGDLFGGSVAVSGDTVVVGANQDASAYVFGQSGTNQAPVVGDYDGDGDSDFAIYRPAERTWYIRGVPPFVQWGGVGDIPVPGDYDGDGTTEIAVYSPDDGIWFVRGQDPAQWQQWGIPGSATEIPVPADYDGNNTTDVAIYRQPTATFFVKGQFTLQLGQVGDIPVPGNYDADPAFEAAVYRPSTRTWLIDAGGGQVTQVQWGNVGDVPAPGDFNGDGQTDITTYSPADGYWWPKDQTPYIKWGGIAGDVPVPGSYVADASDTDERTIYRRAAGSENGVWYIQGASSLWAQWGGQAGDVVLNVPPALWLQYYD